MHSVLNNSDPCTKAFHDPVQLAAAFKSRFGMSPREVRLSGAPLLSTRAMDFSFPQHLIREVANTMTTA